VLVLALVVEVPQDAVMAANMVAVMSVAAVELAVLAVVDVEVVAVAIKVIVPTAAYFSPAEWDKLSYDKRGKIRAERDKKGKPGGTKQNISELTTKQLTTALISSIQKAVVSDD
jgi:hypothetical protein